jgi:hypothetical protein
MSIREYTEPWTGHPREPDELWRLKPEQDSRGSTMWPWIAGIIAVIVAMALVYGYSRKISTMAQNSALFFEFVGNHRCRPDNPTEGRSLSLCAVSSAKIRRQRRLRHRWPILFYRLPLDAGAPNQVLWVAQGCYHLWRAGRMRATNARGSRHSADRSD